MSVGTRRFIHIGGRQIPGIQLTEAVQQPVLLPSGRTILGMFAEVLSLRETNPVNPETGLPQPTTTYLTTSIENLRFSTLRFEPVVGLDYDEDGNALSMQQLEERRAADIMARQAVRAAAAAPTVIPLTATDAPAEG